MKWPELASKSGMGIAETLATVTPALAEQGRGRPAERDMRVALYSWAFSTRARANGDPPTEVTRTIQCLLRANPGTLDIALPLVSH
jgi:hypothetical protein